MESNIKTIDEEIFANRISWTLKKRRMGRSPGSRKVIVKGNTRIISKSKTNIEAQVLAEFDKVKVSNQNFDTALYEGPAFFHDFNEDGKFNEYNPDEYIEMALTSIGERIQQNSHGNLTYELGENQMIVSNRTHF